MMSNMKLGSIGILGALASLMAGGASSPEARTEARKIAARPLPRERLALTKEQRLYHWPGFTGPRVMSGYMKWFQSNGATSRKELLSGKHFYKPHQGAKERARNAKRSASA